MNVWRIVEQFYPLVFAVVTGVSSYVWGTQTLYDGAARSLGEVVGASSIIVGFLATSMAILMSFGSNELIEKLKAAGSYKRILGYLWRATISALLLVGYSIVLRFFEAAPWFATTVQTWAVTVWVALAVKTFFSSFRSIHIMYVLLQALSGK